jgi:hypothetical protein
MAMSLGGTGVTSTAVRASADALRSDPSEDRAAKLLGVGRDPPALRIPRPQERRRAVDTRS